MGKATQVPQVDTCLRGPEQLSPRGLEKGRLADGVAGAPDCILAAWLSWPDCGTERLAEVEYIPTPTGTEQRRSCRDSASYIFSFKSLFCVCFKCGFPFLFSPQFPLSQQGDPVVLSCLAFSLGLFQGPGGGGASELHNPEWSAWALGLASYCHLEVL